LRLAGRFDRLARDRIDVKTPVDERHVSPFVARLRAKKMGWRLAASLAGGRVLFRRFEFQAARDLLPRAAAK
jgi:hypothetical protein